MIEIHGNFPRVSLFLARLRCVFCVGTTQKVLANPFAEHHNSPRIQHLHFQLPWFAHENIRQRHICARHRVMDELVAFWRLWALAESGQLCTFVVVFVVNFAIWLVWLGLSCLSVLMIALSQSSRLRRFFLFFNQQFFLWSIAVMPLSVNSLSIWVNSLGWFYSAFC